MRNLSAGFERSVARDGAAAALLSGRRAICYAELEATVNGLADALGEMGVGSGQRACAWFDGGIAAIATVLAILRRGAVYVPIDPRVPATGTALWCKHYEAAAFITTPDRWGLVASEIDRHVGVVLVD